MFNKTNSPSGTTSTAKAPSAASAPRMASAGAPSILGRDIVITGDIKTDGDVQIDGRLDGNITAGTVTIGEQGAVNGKIIAQNVHVRGKVTGKVESNVVELAETANVQADLVQDQLMIANGAFFDGKCARKSASPTPIKAAKKSA
ncbi:MAG: polymer-forming cytoskeletal protein [Litorimonas sp.]